jgi:hypothetical protein
MQTLVREMSTKQTVLALLATHPWCFACAVPAASIAKSSSLRLGMMATLALSTTQTGANPRVAPS